MERSSPSRTAGLCLRKVTIGDTEYVLSQCDKVRRAADEEMVICARRKLPRGLSDAERMAALNILVCGIANSEEWQNYRMSLWHAAFRFWNALDPADRETKAGIKGTTPAALLEGVEWAYELLSSDDRTQEEFGALWTAIRAVSQEELIKN